MWAGLLLQHGHAARLEVNHGRHEGHDLVDQALAAWAEQHLDVHGLLYHHLGWACWMTSC